jgi:hypothetical protein
VDARLIDAGITWAAEEPPSSTTGAELGSPTSAARGRGAKGAGEVV